MALPLFPPEGNYISGSSLIGHTPALTSDNPPRSVLSGGEDSEVANDGSQQGTEKDTEDVSNGSTHPAQVRARPPPAYGSIRQHTSAYVRIRKKWVAGRHQAAPAPAPGKMHEPIHHRLFRK